LNHFSLFFPSNNSHKNIPNNGGSDLTKPLAFTQTDGTEEGTGCSREENSGNTKEEADIRSSATTAATATEATAKEKGFRATPNTTADATTANDKITLL
jgi:hypothetical protein